VTRALLSTVICALCVGLGLASAQVQARNHERAARLDELKRRCDLVEAGNETLRFHIRVRLAEIERAEALGAPPDAPEEDWPTR